MKRRLVTLSSLFLLLLLFSTVLYSQLAAAYHGVPFGDPLSVQPAPVAPSANHALSAASEAQQTSSVRVPFRRKRVVRLASLSNARQGSSVITNDDDLFGEAADNALGGQNVEFVGHIGGTTNAVFVQGNYAYIGVGPRLTILDISNPASPTVVGKTAPMPGIVQDIYLSGNYAYVAAGSSGLRVIDVSAPTSPNEVGFFETPGDALGVAVVDNYAYVADYDGGLRVIDVSAPTSPTEVGFFETPADAYGVAVVDNYAYVAASHGGLRVIDVSAPTSPPCVGFFDTPGSARGVAVVGNYAYVADSDGGLLILQFTGGEPTPTVTPTATQPPTSVELVGFEKSTSASSRLVGILMIGLLLCAAGYVALRVKTP